MIYITRLLAVLLACCAITAFADQPKTPPVPQSLEELKVAIEKIRVDTGLPGLGIALVDKNGPYWVAGLGEADVASHKPATENSLFRIGSTSKMFVALSVLKLVEEGKLNLNDKLSDLAPEISFDNPWEKTNPILLVHLLEHTTGWDDIGFAVYSKQDAKMPIKEALDFHPQYRHSRWIPGTRYAYNNAGPVVAAYIVQKVSGQLYEDYVQMNFFDPLQMSSTTFFESALFKQQGVSLYDMGGKAQPYWNLILRPAGSINSSAADMAKFLQFFINRGGVNQQHLISADSITRMETPTTTLGARAGAVAGYGLHNYVDGFEAANIAFRGHDGDVAGGHCRFRYVLELQMGYVLLVNQDNPQALDQLPKLIRAYLLKDVRKKPLTEIPLPEKFKALDGYYRAINPRSDFSKFPSDVFSVMRFKVSGNRLHREPLLGGWEKPSEDYAIDENRLANAWTGLPTIAFVNDPLAGEAVEVTDGLIGSLFQKVSPVRVFGVLGWMGATGFLTATSFIFCLVWIVRLARGRLQRGITIGIRTWPLLTGAVLIFALVAPGVFQPGIEDIGRVSTVTLITFLCSILYPFLAVWSLVNCIRHRKASVNRVMFWHSLTLSVLHCGVALLLTCYGYLALRMWV